MGFDLRPNNKGLMYIVHNGEREEAIVTGAALEAARKAYDNSDLQGYIDIWKANT
jgi:hypothetical protein